ncbi:MAG: MotA/TolQ/ExbB proton channel family protein [Desulfatibacillaceae bacterium]|nr:MotA/TolQ/ExbB proton channel family protein [Desulfatibacillaceae bacterium]
MGAGFYSALAGAVEHFESGGPLMYPLALLCVVLGLLITYKALWFFRMNHKDEGRAQACLWVERGQPDKDANPHSLASLLVKPFLARRTGDPKTDRGILQEIEKSLSARLFDHLAAIGVLAGIAPLLGLLGTVLGMMAAFDVLMAFGTGNVAAMSKSISQALVTTKTGLLIAIPGLYGKGFLERRAQNARMRLSRIVMHLAVRAGEKSSC